MKNECDIVKDLLFSYNDGVLSEASKNFVEKHLKTCESCNNVLKEIRQESGETEQKKEIDAFKGVRKKISKRNVIISVSVIIILIIIIFNVLVFVNYNKMITTMQIILQKDITEEQLEDIENVIRENASEVEIKYLSSDEQLNMMQNWLEEDANILEPYRGSEDNSPFRTILIVNVKDNEDIQKIMEAVKDMPGTYKTFDNIEQNPYLLFLSQILYR